MVHLKCIDNPFTEKVMMNISKFCDERSFYDCINRRFLNDQAFQHLEHTFYMYALTGDCEEWIGYVLLSNENRVNGYFRTAYENTLLLLENYKTQFKNANNQEKLGDLEKLIIQNDKSDNFREIVEEVTSSLKKLSVLEFLNNMKSKLNSQRNQAELTRLEYFIDKSYDSREWSAVLEKLLSLLNQSNIPYFQTMYDMFSNYWEQLQQYLDSYPSYFYLDVVIALPKEEQITIQKENAHLRLSADLLAESKYYGFIQEALATVEEEIKQRFHNVPILLSKENQNVFFVNIDSLSNDGEQIVKQIYNNSINNL